MSITIEPAELPMAAGAVCTAKLTNTTETRLAYKVKLAQKEHYGISPFGFIEPKSDAPLEVRRKEGPSGNHKMVVQWVVVTAGDTDPKKPFESPAIPQGQTQAIIKAE